MINKILYHFSISKYDVSQLYKLLYKIAYQIKSRYSDIFCKYIYKKKKKLHFQGNRLNEYIEVAVFKRKEKEKK